MAASPAVAGFVGAGSASDAAKTTQAMSEITITMNPEWTIPSIDYLGVPTGIDIRLVVETGIVPMINTGIAHKKPGIGQVGAGVVKAPRACFERALRGLAESLGVRMSEKLNIIRKSLFLDSVALMRISKQLWYRGGVQEAALMMGTPANKNILKDADLFN